ncbi:hypothetical protein RA27_16450 [Ruegeria sp. ANG-R]|nr:hypothetical protein RA27_16450 [Ruegeria sp. ANG-R]
MRCGARLALLTLQLTGANSASAEVNFPCAAGYHSRVELMTAIEADVFAVCNIHGAITYREPDRDRNGSVKFFAPMAVYADSIVIIDNEPWLNLRPPLGQVCRNSTLGLVKLANMNCMFGDQNKK